MLRLDEAIGSIGVTRREPGGFTDDEIALLKTFADQAVIAIENVRLFNDTKEALEQQTATRELLRVISSSPTDVQPVFVAIVRVASGLRVGLDGIAVHFSERQIALLQTFADQAVIAIENVRLFTELQERNKALTQAHAQVSEALEQQTATSEILKVISSSPTDVRPVFDSIIQNAVRLCGGFNGTVFRFDGSLIHVAAHHNFAPEAADVVNRVFPIPADRGSVTGRAI